MKSQESFFPDNYIERSIRVDKKENHLNVVTSGRSTYHEYTKENIWNENILDNIYKISEDILDYINTCSSLEKKPYYDKKLVSLDIETTTWIPKAREGFVNILGVSIIDLRDYKPFNAELLMYQAFNMLRKKEQVYHLINLAQKYIDDADIMIVFNKSFDIKILQTIIENFNLKYEFPEQIIDLKVLFRSLAALEEHLYNQVDFQRMHSEKGQYKEYYELFKGKEKKVIGKKIEPIGIYNLMDTLTPLYALLLMDKFPSSI